MSERILVVDDEPSIVELVAYNLRSAGYEVMTAADGVEALAMIDEDPPDLVLLDVMLPELDGFSVCQRIRKSHNMPIIMLTARGGEEDKVWGLEIGADDYITKPFSPKELLARVRAALRRHEGDVTEQESKVIHMGELTIDEDTRRVYLGETLVELTPKEFDLLSYMAKNTGRVLSRDLLLRILWGYEYTGGTRTVDVHVRRLRQKLNDTGDEPRFIETVHGVGYRFLEQNNA